MDLSVVIPVYNEEENIRPLYDELKPVLEKTSGSYEILFIDDGSCDGTFAALEKLHQKDKAVKVIRFRKNFGQTAAMSAGFDNARGNVIVTMDGDLQNDPKDIPKLIEKLDEYDVVSGWRHDRKDSIGKSSFSRISNWLGKRLTNLDIHDSGCSLKAYRRESVEGISLFGEMHRYIPAIIAMNGFSIGEVKVNHRPRKHGKTKYGMKRLLKGTLDLSYIKFWSSYSTRPLHLFGSLGVALLALGFLIGLAKVLDLVINGRELVVGAALMLSVLLLILGVQFIIFGFLGEIQVRTYYNTAKERGYKIRTFLK